ncbi:MAG: hypothetical protein ACTH31_09785, partial [Pseudoclavibacter sp.]
AQRAANILAAAVAPMFDIGATFEQRELNGQPGAVMHDRDGGVLGVWVLEILDGQIQTIRSVTNPEKLAHLGPVGDLRATTRERNLARRAERLGRATRDDDR